MCTDLQIFVYLICLLVVPSLLYLCQFVAFLVFQLYLCILYVLCFVFLHCQQYCLFPDGFSDVGFLLLEG